MTRKTALAASVVLLAFVGTKIAFAHAILMRCTPADHAVVHHGDVQMTFDYNSRIDAGRCTLTLADNVGRNLPVRMQPGGTPSELKAVANNLSNGNYYIHWQVLASDGHITRGDVTFTVAK